MTFILVYADSLQVFYGGSCYVMNLNDINLTDSQINEYFRQMQNESHQAEFDAQSDLQALIQTTLHLDYDMSLAEDELKFYKVTLAEKECEVKRLKEKLGKKNARVAALNESLKKLGTKIQEIGEGYKKLSQQSNQCISNEQIQRNQRLAYQQKKSLLHQTYAQLQQNYNKILDEIDQYGEVEQQYGLIKLENEELQRQIDELIDRKKQANSEEAIDRKDHLKNEVKKMYEKIKMAEKQDQNICQEYETNRKALSEVQRVQNGINNKNFEIESLYHRIERIKQDLKNRRWEKTEKERELMQLTHQESHLRRQANAQAEFRSSQRRAKEQTGHNFKIIDSEADEDLAKTGEKVIGHYQSCNIESQEQLDQLINRFQKIKSKSKHL